MIVNRSKSKEMILGSLAKQSVPCLTVQFDVIERVTSFKLLGVTLSNDLSWEAHVNTVCAKVAPRLYYLKPVFFNQGSAEPKGSASVCQGFRSWPVTNNLACKITPANIVEILSVDFFCLKLRFYASFA